MSTLVVDASIAVKWIVPETDSAQANTLLDGAHTLIAPDLIWVEVANALWRVRKKGIVTSLQAENALDESDAYPVHLHASYQLLVPAFRIAAEHDRTIYDSLYVALAIRERATLITSDNRLVNALANSPLAGRAKLLADL